MASQEDFWCAFVSAKSTHGCTTASDATITRHLSPPVLFRSGVRSGRVPVVAIHVQHTWYPSVMSSLVALIRVLYQRS